MAKQQFITKNFKPATLHIIAQADAVLREYHAKGFTMTLRQVHYQFVARKLPDINGVPYANTDNNYDRLGSILSDARLAGLIDWSMMEDRLRTLERVPRWDSPADIIRTASHSYQEDLWAGQKVRPEVWIEKDALAGVIANVCEELRVDYFACRGYVSASAQYEAARRFRGYLAKGQRPVVLHLGDHDPSGLDMSRENAAKFELLAGTTVELRRLALNYDQIEEYNPPPNPAKMSDGRAPKYVAEYGSSSWELDALDPDVIETLIREAVTPYINKTKWKEALAAEQEGQNTLEKCSDNWPEVVELLNGIDDQD